MLCKHENYVEENKTILTRKSILRQKTKDDEINKSLETDKKCCDILKIKTKVFNDLIICDSLSHDLAS